MRARIVASMVGSSAMEILAFSAAFTKTFGLLVVFVGIGIVVNILIAYIAVQVRGEREQNRQYAASRQRRE
jgi:hypothetical protein